MYLLAIACIYHLSAFQSQLYPSEPKPIYGATAAASQQNGSPVMTQTTGLLSTRAAVCSSRSDSSIESSIDAVLASSRCSSERSIALISSESAQNNKVSSVETVELRPLQLDTTGSSSSFSDCGTGVVSPCSSASRSTPGSSVPLPSGDVNVKCSICEDRASGYHYGVTSCEGCKVASFTVIIFTFYTVRFCWIGQMEGLL